MREKERGRLGGRGRKNLRAQEKKRRYERYIVRNKDGVFKVGKEMERQREKEKGIEIEKERETDEMV